MKKIHVIDLHFLDTKDAIATFLIETSEGPILIETGPESTFLQLRRAINEIGYQIEDVQHVFLTHIHFDHAGAAWKFAEAGAKIYVHPIGLSHLASPEKLWNSASQIYGDEMERLWGKMLPISEKNIEAVKDKASFDFGEITIQGFHTPGHAVHHIAWKVENVIFTGDVGGVKIDQGPVVPPCPPPDIHLENWFQSIKVLEELNPNVLFLTHFGKILNPKEHFEELKIILNDWSEWMRPYFESGEDQKEIVPKFTAYTKEQLLSKGVDKFTIQIYEYANPSWMSVAGLMRYWKLKNQGRI